MKRLLIALVVLALAAGVANATRPTVETAGDLGDVSPSRAVITVWFDDMEGGDNNWTHGDLTAGSTPPYFHVDTYMAYGGTGSSWWCGRITPGDPNGGYGNSWYEYLKIPTTDVSSAGAYAVLTFAFRYDSEPTYDFTFIQAESLGVWKDLESFDGYGAWYDIGAYGYLVGSYDSPLDARFLFVSDGAWSDDDGLYLSVGGGFACDNVKLFDGYVGTIFFYDDAESGGLCIPGRPGAAGDWWHRRYDDCSSFSGHYSWWCGDDADTSLIPPLLQNWLDTPWINISTVANCLVRTKLHAEVPTVDNDYVTRYVTFDGVTYYFMNASWGDFGQCGGWSTAYWNGKEISTLPGVTWPQSQCQIRWTMYTTANGCGPGAGGGAGITIDDMKFEGEEIISPVQERSWGGIKSLYR